MQFDPHTEKEIAEAKLWPKGVYTFEITEACEKVSQSSGNPMIQLKIKLSDGNGKVRTISDYLTAGQAGKLRHAAAATGLLDRYETGSLTDRDFLGKRGKLKLGIEKGKDGYPDKNTVIDYLCEGAEGGNGEPSWVKRANTSGER